MSTATLKTRLSDAVKDAMRAKAAERLATLRFLLAAVKQKEVDERRDLTDAEITQSLRKPSDAAVQFTIGKRALFALVFTLPDKKCLVPYGRAAMLVNAVQHLACAVFAIA